ncbi:hypothetical protein EZM97_14765 [Dyella soli]|uniref:DUF1134 domain-containing protein n=2 Tax=Dyella soli TaxID=522319 RepID=A0A4R0YWS4_9GAMM|nr:hypothetical protein [Dyella soli]TCI11378.1 hypothetical protein EZM97_14765 [Dyella soli]
MALGFASILGTFSASAVQAADAGVTCHMSFGLSGWSVIYKHASGTGVVTCSNGEHANVKITMNGGGLTAGKYRINDGKGEITDVRGIADVFGDYAQAGAEAGILKSGESQLLTKGTTSLALHGSGEGINLGLSVGAVSVSRY